MNRTAAVVVAAVLASAIVFATETITRVFFVEHVSVMEVSVAIQPWLSEEGSMTIQPRHSRITVQDLPSVVERVAELVETMDRAPGVYRVHFELLRGSRQPFSGAEISSLEADPRLQRMFNFPAFKHLAGTTIEGQLGGVAEAELGPGYEISFQPEPVEVAADTPWGSADPGDRLALRHLVLEQVGIDDDGLRRSKLLLKTTMTLAANQKVYVGAGSSEEADDGLILIVHALETGVR